MFNTNCATCGAGNQIGQAFCVACGANLGLQTATVPADSFPARTHEWQPFQIPGKPLPGIAQFGIGPALSAGLRLYFSNIWLITKIVFVVVAPFEVFRAVSLAQGRQDWQTILLTLLLGAVCNVLIAPALIYALMKVLETGTTPGVKESFRWGLTRFWPVAVCAAVSWVLQILGYALCIIPGIIVSLTLALVYPIATLERQPTEEVLRRSSVLTRGYRLEMLVAGIVLGVVVGAIGIPVLLLMNGVDWPPLNVIGGIIVDILEQATTVLSLVIYLSLIRTPRRGRLPGPPLI